MILTRENFTVEEYISIKPRQKPRKIWRLVIISGTHKLHNNNFNNPNAAVAHRSAILGQTVKAYLEQDGEYYRVHCLNNFYFHSEKLNLASAVKLMDDLH